MGQGLFLLLCVLALIIGSRARNSKALSPKTIKTRKKIKRVLSIGAVVIIGLVVLLFIPAVITETKIAIDTHFTTENYLSMAVIVIGTFTFIAIIRNLRKE